MLTYQVFATLFMVICTGAEFRNENIADLVTRFRPGCSRTNIPILAIANLDNNVVSLAKRLVGKGWIGFQTRLEPKAGSCIVVGLKFNPKRICNSSTWFSLGTRTSLLVRHQKELDDCPNLGIDSNVFTYKLDAKQTCVYEHYKHVENRLFCLNKTSRNMNMLPVGDRRRNLNGIKIKAKIDRYALPWITDPEDGQHGILIDAMESIAKTLNITIDYQMSKPLESSSKIIREVGESKYDIGLSSFAMTLDRFKVINYGVPFHSNKNANFFYCRVKSEFSAEILLKPFHMKGWIALITYGFVTTIILMMTFGWLYGWKRTYLEDSIGLILVTMINRKVRVEPTHASGRIVLLTALAAGFLILTMYNTIMGAILAITQYQPPINGLEDLIDNDLKVYVLQGSSAEALFINAPKDNIFKRISNNGNLATFQPLEAFPTIKDALLKGNLFYGDADYYPKLDGCRMKALSAPLPKFQRAVVFPKTSPISDIFNHHLLKIRPWLQSKHAQWEWRKQIGNIEDESRQPIDLAQCYGILIIFLSGLGFSLMIFGLEIIMKLTDT